MSGTKGLVVSTSPSFGKYSREPVDLLESHGYRVGLLGRHSEDALMESLATAHAWIVGFEPVNAKTLVSSPLLRVVAKSGAGLDNFDLPYLEDRGIAVVSVPGGNARAVAEYTMSQILSLTRGTVLNDASIRNGIWKPNIGVGLDGRTIGVVGFGAIGRFLTVMAKAFDMRVVVADPFVDPAEVAAAGAEALPLEELLLTSDLVSLHVPLTPETHHMIGSAQLALMKPGSYIINNSRGGIIEETSLIAALTSQHLAGAALDVFELEPLVLESELFTAPNLILSSHTSGYSDTTLAAVTFTCAQSVLRCLSDTKSD